MPEMLYLRYSFCAKNFRRTFGIIGIPFSSKSTNSGNLDNLYNIINTKETKKEKVVSTENRGSENGIERENIAGHDAGI